MSHPPIRCSCRSNTVLLPDLGDVVRRSEVLLLDASLAAHLCCNQLAVADDLGVFGTRPPSVPPQAAFGTIRRAWEPWDRCPRRRTPCHLRQTFFDGIFPAIILQKRQSSSENVQRRGRRPQVTTHPMRRTCYEQTLYRNTHQVPEPPNGIIFKDIARNTSQLKSQAQAPVGRRSHLPRTPIPYDHQLHRLRITSSSTLYSSDDMILQLASVVHWSSSCGSH